VNWLIHTTSGLLARIVAGAMILLILALIDLRKHGARATRWREYTFLLACVFAAMLYGIINDQITSAISWEYFYYGKELEHVVGPTIPPNRTAMCWEAAKIGATATWSVGLIVGAALLIANNPRKNRPQLPYSALIQSLAPILVTAMLCAIVLGFAGWFGWLDWISSDFRLFRETDSYRPAHFMATYGAHLGGYVGGALGTLVAVCCIIVRRHRMLGNLPN
jgi:hypothetical protein